MSLEKQFLKTIFTLMLLSSFAVAGPALSGTKTFTQPDGTKFEGVLKGDSSFHWIESDGNIVIYNPKDKFYYKAIIDENYSLKRTNEKPAVKIENMAPSINGASKKHDVAENDKRKLRVIHKKTKTGNYPR